MTTRHNNVSQCATAAIACVRRQIVTLGGIAFILLLCGCSSTSHRTHLNDSATAARNIHLAVITKEMKGVVPTRVWPQSIGPFNPATLQFATSTEYFRWLHSCGLIDSSWVIPMGNVDPHGDTIDSNNNMWIVAVGVGEHTYDYVPVLLSANVGVSNLSNLTGAIQNTLQDVPPFGRREIVVQLKGGGTYLLKVGPRQRWEDVLGGPMPDHQLMRP